MSVFNTNTHKLLFEKYQTHFINKGATAKELQVSKATVDRLRKAGTLRSKRIGGQIFFKLTELADFIES